MFLNARKFNYVSFNGSMTSRGSDVYTNPDTEIIPHQGMFLTWVSMCMVTAPLIIILLVCLKGVLICQCGF